MGTVTISAVSYTVYGEHAGAGSLTEYANASLAYAATFGAATADDQKRALVEATRILDRQLWQGAKVDAGQVLAWPRTGVVYADGSPVSSAVIPAEAIAAAYELALAGLATPAVFTEVTTSKREKRVKAGSAEVEYFAPVKGGRWPGRVGELVSQFLAGNAGSAGTVAGAYGIDGESAFDDDDAYGLSGAG